MNWINLIVVTLFVAVFVYFITKNKVVKLNATTKLHSLPRYYSYLAVFTTLFPLFFVLTFWSIVETNVIHNLIIAKFGYLQSLNVTDLALKFSEITAGNSQESSIYHSYIKTNIVLKISTSFAAGAIGFTLIYFVITPALRARNIIENIVFYALISSAIIAIFTTIGIIASIIFEALEFFKQIPFTEFLFGTHWSPQIAIREDQAGSSGAFGALPVFWGTIFISLVAMIIAIPIGLSSAIYLSEYANSQIRNIVKPILETLAGIPTVVYGFFAAITIGPLFRDFGNYLKDIGYSLDIEFIEGFVVSTESVLAAGVVMGMMVVPFVLSLSDDVLSAVPRSMRDGSTALGATKSETVIKVLIPSALPGIIGSFLLAISRAIGETMIVLMAAGVAAKFSINPFDSVTTVTVQIVTLLTGDQEFDSAKTLSAFALALGLFTTTLALNIIALKVVRKYREQYE